MPENTHRDKVTRRPAKVARSVQRSVHLVASVLLLAYLYSPLGENPVFDVMVRVMIIPVLVGSGVVMWQWRRVRALGRGGSAARSGRRPARA